MYSCKPLTFAPAGFKNNRHSGNPESGIRNPKSKIRNSEFEIRNPKCENRESAIGRFLAPILVSLRLRTSRNGLHGDPFRDKRWKITRDESHDVYEKTGTY